ncbi:uncharacterized protein [Mytilus edulis]|uniref:uncharacterized protein n=1 Tax=Mytilus edulis TaxID=6550 RepID=UPI0039EFD5E7
MPPSRRASPLHAGPPTMPPSRRTSPLYAGPPTMPHGEGTHLSSSPEPHIKGALVPRPPPMSCGEGQEHAYMPRPPSMSRNEERMHMPRPPPGPRGVRHAFMPQPPTVQREDHPHMPTVPKEDGPFYYKRKTTVKLEQMDIFPHPNTQLGLGPEVLNYMPTPPSVTQRCGSERNIRGQSQQKGGDRKTLPPLQRKRPY